MVKFAPCQVYKEMLFSLFLICSISISTISNPDETVVLIGTALDAPLEEHFYFAELVNTLFSHSALHWQ